MGRYAEAKLTKIIDKDIWIERRDIRASAASVRACRWFLWSSPLSLDAVLSARMREKKRRDVSSMGWNTIRAMREPAAKVTT